MRQFPVVAALIVISFFAFISPTFAAVTIQKPTFTLSLPDGWVEIPQNVLSTMQAELKRQAPNAKIPKYDYGFQRETSNKWIEYPYILIQVVNTGRIQEHQLKSMPKIDLNERLKDRTTTLQSIMSNAVVGKMQYDEAAHIVWITTQSDVVNVGKIQGLSGLIPTEKGFVQVHAYSTEPDFQNYLPIFRQIITSTTVSPDLAYKPRWSDSSSTRSGIDWEQIAINAIIGGVMGGLIVFLAGIKRKKNRK